MRSSATNHDDYIAEFPEATQVVLTQMRELIRSLVPEAVETISYAIPTFDVDGRHLVHYAGYEHHVGFYPGGKLVGVFADELTGYKTGKGSVQFPLAKPLPVDLITRMTVTALDEAKARKKR
ncbi:MAG: hypothetical protein HGB10_01070 [Coriobacteriia bacterium]|nr:hypothetical protein [Coriobacteriia bacterium]